VCVDKNERADDSRFKSWIQNVLGGLVLVSISAVSTGYIVLRDTSRDHTLQLGVIVKSLDKAMLEIERFKLWQIGTERDRFRNEDGATLFSDLSKLRDAMNMHNAEAKTHIERIDHNSKAIDRIRQKSHTHNGYPDHGVNGR
jgi:hypothetical protein